MTIVGKMLRFIPQLVKWVTIIIQTGKLVVDVIPKITELVDELRDVLNTIEAMAKEDAPQTRIAGSEKYKIALAKALDEKVTLLKKKYKLK